ncbi:MAG: hypothetical protein V4445_05010 [Pseudomonadota bacterium]
MCRALKVHRSGYYAWDAAKSDVEYIEVFYNCKRRHGYLNQMSQMAFAALQTRTIVIV